MDQPQSTISLRPVSLEEDIERLAALYTLALPEEMTGESLRAREARTAMGLTRHRMVAVDECGMVVGLGQARHGDWQPEDVWDMLVVVDRGARNRGIGAHLYRSVHDVVREHSGTTIKTMVRDNVPDDLHFAQSRGFQIDRHLFQSTLDLASFDETPFAAIIPAVEAAGIRLFSFADIEDTLPARRKIYDLNDRLICDIPGFVDGFPSFEDFVRTFFEGPNYRPDGLVIATEGEQWIGFAAHGYFQSMNAMINMMTGVVRDYRGRNIALALKLMGIASARRHGADYLLTNNDSDNLPMLAVNRRLGYRQQPGWYSLVLTTGKSGA